MSYPSGSLYPSTSSFPASGVAVAVFANSAFTPPRMEVTCSIPTGNIMQSAELTRIVDGVAVDTRTQPSTGFDSRVVVDYEMPYDKSVTYQFTTTFLDPSAVTTVFDEAWSNLTAWTGDTGHFGVTLGSKAIMSPYVAGGWKISHAMPAQASYRAVISSLTASGVGVYQTMGVEFADNAGHTVLLVSPTTNGTITVSRSIGGAGAATGISGTNPVTVDFLGGSIIVTGTGGSYTLPGLRGTDWATINVRTNFYNSGSTFAVGEIKTSSYGVSYAGQVTSTPAIISPANSWMIHPSNPSLSVPISSQDRSTATIRSIGDITNPSNSTEHQILGQSNPIVTNSGPRLSSRLTMVIGTKTTAQEKALFALLGDGTPVLFRFPASFNIGFDDGFYAVGDIGRGRFAQRPGDALRNFTLPLTQVQSPVVVVQNAGWSDAALAAEFATWAQVAAAFNTYADVASNNRNPGF